MPAMHQKGNTEKLTGHTPLSSVNRQTLLCAALMSVDYHCDYFKQRIVPPGKLYHPNAFEVSLPFCQQSLPRAEYLVLWVSADWHRLPAVTAKLHNTTIITVKKSCLFLYEKAKYTTKGYDHLYSNPFSLCSTQINT